MTKIKNRNKQMNDSLSIIIILLTIAGMSWLSYTIINQQQQIIKLEQQLQHEQLKYKMLFRDPVVRDAIESGG
uniref:Interact CLIP, MHC2 interacting n=1 Tax=Siphoviridae sp. ctWsj12 TaxID=2826363 RepID=A0A8S5NRB2_9CAUD|nr:MAG TPA: interact CLIP, MHC2 interacting [Siphoviridae sp. ctWsj12]